MKASPFFIFLSYLTLLLTSCKDDNLVEDSIWFSARELHENEFILEFQNDSVIVFDTQARSLGFLNQTIPLSSAIVSCLDTSRYLIKGEIDSSNIEFYFSLNQDTLFCIGSGSITTMPFVKRKRFDISHEEIINTSEYILKNTTYKFLENGLCLLKNESGIYKHRFRLEKFKGYKLLVFERNTFIISQIDVEGITITNHKNSYDKLLDLNPHEKLLQNFKGLWINKSNSTVSKKVSSKQKTTLNSIRLPPPPPPPVRKRKKISSFLNESKKETALQIINSFGEEEAEKILNDGFIFNISDDSLQLIYRNHIYSKPAELIFDKTTIVVPSEIDNNPAVFEIIEKTDSSMVIIVKSLRGEHRDYSLYLKGLVL